MTFAIVTEVLMPKGTACTDSIWFLESDHYPLFENTR